MFKRAVFLSSVLGAVSAACALAFVPELSRVGRALSMRASARAQGFTAVPPSSMERLHRSIGNVSSLGEADSLQGKYCPFPAKGQIAHGGGAESSFAPAPDSLSDLNMAGQSSVPKPAGNEATCAGSPAPSPVAPRVEVP